MDYKIDPNHLREYLKKIDLGALRKPYEHFNAGFTGDYDRGTESPSSAPMEKNDLTHRVKMAKSFVGLNEFTASRVKDIEQLLALLIMRGSINPDVLEGTVVDFGMGTGPGAYVLKQYGGNVTGVDSSESDVQTAIEEGILPKEKALVQDGFDYLRGLLPKSLDFLAVFMMQWGFPHERLYREAERVLKTGGQLLITGGHTELKDELQRAVGKYGRLEKVITAPGDAILRHVAFVYTKLA